MKKLLEKIEIIGTIVLETGLHIGGTNNSMSIGGIDKGVIRNPLNNQPYIPGSSLKGKMRALYEQSLSEFGPGVGRGIQFGPSKDIGKTPAQIFGNATGGSDQRPSRLIVRDAYLLDAEELLRKTDLPYTEGKTEVVIDRVTSAANPRQIERVPAGAKFKMNMVLNIYENEAIGITNVLHCLKLLKDDYLGGSGSRGYGQVTFIDIKILKKTIKGYYGQNESVEDITDDFSTYLQKLSD